MYLVRSIRLKNDVAIVKRSIYGIPLGKAKADISSRFLSRLCKLLKLRLSGNDRGIVIAFPVFPPVLASFPDAEAEIHPNGVSGNKKLRKDDEIRFLCGSLGDPLKRLFRDALLSNMTGSACTNAILQLFSMSFMAVDLSFLKISIRRAVRSLYYLVSGGFKRLYRFLVILLFDQKIVRIVSRYCKNRDVMIC